MTRARAGLTISASVMLVLLLAACRPGASTPTMGGAAKTTPAVTGAGVVSPASSPGAAADPAQKTAGGYPARAIEMIVAFGAGGAADTSARLLSAYLQPRWGVPINVVDVPGGSGTVGTLRGLQAAPDGYTVLLDNHATTSLLARIIHRCTICTVRPL